MNFGKAIEKVKEGHHIYRDGWNGSGMFVLYQKGYPEGIGVNRQTAEAYGIEEGSILKFRPYLQLYTAQGDCAMWSPSTSDALAEDWHCV